MENSFLRMLMLVALGLLVDVDAQGSAGTCIPIVRVRRNTVKVFRKNPLKLSCPVRYCEEIPTVRWIRVDETGRLIPVNQTDEITVTQEVSTAEREIISYLNFRNISIQDDGLYKCQVSALDSTLESHSINVSVSDLILQTHNETAYLPHFETAYHIWKPYIVICSCVFILVISVMLISLLILHGHSCSRKPAKDTAQCTTAVFNLVETSPASPKHTEGIPA